MKRILFVEDDPRGVNPYFNNLRLRGYECIAAHNGDEALRRLRREKFDLLSLDVMFDPGQTLPGVSDPRRSGLRLLEHIRSGKIRNCDPQMKVMVLTAIENPPVEEKIKKLGVLDYLKKPVAFDKVIAAITQAVQEDKLDVTETDRSLLL